MDMHREPLLLGTLAAAVGAVTWWQCRKHFGRH
jgi:hypothetical protein